MNEWNEVGWLSRPGAAAALGIAILSLSACGPGEAGEQQAAEAIDAADLVQGIKDLLGLDELSAEEILHILDTAESF